MNMLEEIRTETEGLIALRRYFHAHPEPSREEVQTAARIRAELDALGIPNEPVGETGVYGAIKGTKEGEKVIVLRADIDALRVEDAKEAPYRSQNPGVMHACGHDLQTAALLGAAKVLKEQENQFGGEVRLFFQQAEEIGYGAKVFLKEGRLQGADRVFGLHAASDLAVGTVGLRSGPNNASVDHFRITVHGKGAHVSTPQRGADALYMAAQIVTALQGVVTRQTSPTQPALIGVGTLQAGTAYNVIAEKAVLEGTIRTMTPDIRAFIRDQVNSLAAQTAGLYGGTAEVEWTDYASPLINDPACCLEAAAVVEGLWGPGAVVRNREISLGGDDFAEFLLQVPGVYAYVGTGNPESPNTTEPHHSCLFDIDEEAVPIATALYAGYAFGWLTGSLERI